MAIQKILTIHEVKNGKPYRHLANAIDYICNDEKTQGGKNVFGINCNSDLALKEMLEVKKIFDKTDQRQGYHFILSFSPEDNVTPEMCNEITKEFCEKYFQNRFQVIVATHDDKSHLHSHVIFNSVSFVDGLKYRYEKGDWKKIIMPILNELCEKHGLSVLDIEDKEDKSFSDNKYNPANKVMKKSLEKEMDIFIDKAKSFDDFLSLLRKAGYGVKIRGENSISIKPPGWKGTRRLSSLNNHHGYNTFEIKQRIASKIKKQPRSFIESGSVTCYRERTIIGLKKTWATKVLKTIKIGNSTFKVSSKYYDAIKKLNEKMEELNFLRRNNIESTEGLKTFLEHNTKFLEANNTEKKKIIREKKEIEDLSLIKDEMEKLYPFHREFLRGDDFFEDEHKKYLELEEELKKKNMKPEQIENIIVSLEKRYLEVVSKEGKIKKDERLGKKVMSQLDQEESRRSSGKEKTVDKNIEKEKEI